MSLVRVHNLSTSLDGFGTGEGQSHDAPFGHAGERLHESMFATRWWHERGDQAGGTAGIDDAFSWRFAPGIGAEIMGAGKFGPPGRHEDPAWKGWWGPNPPFHTPTFILTHHARPSIEMEGGTTFHFIDASPAEALETARQAAAGQDIRLGGGPTMVRDFLAAGLVDHMHMVVVPILLGRGVRLWDGLEGLEQDYELEAISSPSGVTAAGLNAARAVASTPVAVTDAPVELSDLEPFRRELTGYCYRMLGSAFEAEDAVQETMVRAWKSASSFEGRSSHRSWLYRIATNVCLDMLRSRQRRARPMDLGPASTVDTAQLRVLEDDKWVTPIPDARVLPEAADPADVAGLRESVRLAFVAALQHLPPKQRAVLILCEVLRWQAAEVAELLDTTVASVNSALQRARATLAERDVTGPDARALDADTGALLAKYVDAFERYDMTALVDLVHQDVVMSMPPFDLWLQGADQIVGWMLGPGSKCRGSRLLVTSANGCDAFGQYRVDPAGGHAPWALQVLEVSDGRVVAQHAFVEPRLFPVFGLPEHLG